MRIKLYSKQRDTSDDYESQIVFYIVHEEDKRNEFLNVDNIIDRYVYLSKQHIPDDSSCITVFEGMYEIYDNLVMVNDELFEIQEVYNMKIREFCKKREMSDENYKIEKIRESREEKLRQTKSLEVKFFEKDILLKEKIIQNESLKKLLDEKDSLINVLLEREGNKIIQEKEELLEKELLERKSLVINYMNQSHVNLMREFERALNKK